MEQNSCKFLIISRNRSDIITSHKLFPFAQILVPESEKSDYEHLSNDIETVPDSIIGLGQLRNWILDTYKEEIVIMLDDDITSCRCISRESYYKVQNPDDVKTILLNGEVQNLRDIFFPTINFILFSCITTSPTF